MEREKTTVEGKKIEAAGGRQNVDKYLTSAAQQGNKPAEDWMKAFTPDGVQKVPKTRAQKGIKMAGNAVLAAGRLVKGGKEKERVRTMDRKSKDSLRSNFGGSREDLLNL